MRDSTQRTEVLTTLSTIPSAPQSRAGDESAPRMYIESPER